MKLTDFETMRAQELLIMRASQGLTAAEADELAALGVADNESFDTAGVMIELATKHDDELPTDLADKIFAAAVAKSPTYNASATAPAVPAVAAVLTAPVLQAVTANDLAARAARSPRKTLPTRTAWLVGGWATAAAAAGIAVWAFASGPNRAAGQASAQANQAAVAPNNPDAQTIPMATNTPGAAGVAGSVRWNGKAQQGVLELRGLPANEAGNQRYQLWIFDRQRDDKFPVDAGLFDASSGNTVVPFSPRVKVSDARQFMVTLEAAAGAVVSDRSHVIVVSE
ncbi:MAG TPA: anti-sigma factor [Kofleriaceae bacterium]|nr:anti-sigma factor [Kofleriaceae bacterium]